MRQIFNCRVFSLVSPLLSCSKSSPGQCHSGATKLTKKCPPISFLADSDEGHTKNTLLNHSRRSTMAWMCN